MEGIKGGGNRRVTLLSLPPELRNRIYSYVFEEDAAALTANGPSYHWSQRAYSKTWFKSKHHDIMFASRQLRAECKSLFLTSKIFFVPTQLFQRFVDFVGSDVQCIRGLHWFYREDDGVPLQRVLDFTVRCVALRFLSLNYKGDLPHIKRRATHRPPQSWVDLLETQLRPLHAMRGLEHFRFGLEHAVPCSGYLETEIKVDHVINSWLRGSMCRPKSTGNPTTKG